MLIIGCDYHPGFQQIAFVDQETGECGERRLQHPEEAQQFYRELQAQGRTVCVGMEASGHEQWFERLLGELHFELYIGDAAEIRTKRVRKQKTDRQDAQLLLRLLVEDRFPTIWVPDWENRDLRQLLWHRHRMVQMRTRVMNQLHAVAMNEGLRRKKALWRKAGRALLESLSTGPVGESAAARVAGSAGPTEPEDPGVSPAHACASAVLGQSCLGGAARGRLKNFSPRSHFLGQHAAFVDLPTSN
jgi:transposase